MHQPTCSFELGWSIGGITYVPGRDSATCCPRCKSERQSFRVAGGSLGWQVAGDAFSGLWSRPSGIGFGCSGSGAGPVMSICNPQPGATTRHPKIVQTANRQPLTADTCPLPLSPFTLITHAWPSPLCLQISVPAVIFSVRWPWGPRSSPCRARSPRR